MSTKAEIRAKVESTTGRFDKDTVINYGIDGGLHHAQLIHNFREMETTADLSASEDDLSEALPSGYNDLLEVRLIDDTQSYPLIVKSKKWITSRFPNIAADSSSRPDYVYVQGGSLYFSTPLDDDYTIRITYYKLLTFATDASENPINVLENFLFYEGLAFLYNSLEMTTRGLFWERKARGPINRLGGALLTAVRSDKKRTAEERVLEEFESKDHNARSVYFIVPDSV